MNINKNTIRFLTAFLFSIFPFLLFSQVQKDSVKITELEEIITIGRRQKKEIIPYQKLSGKELENLNSVSVADAIRYFSGVQLKDYGGVGGMKTVNIRGMGSQHVGVFYDGIELGNAQNGTVDLGKFSLDNMESVALYNGQKDQIFQSAKDFGSAGSIYMVTKKPVFTEEKKTNLSINYRSGSFRLVNPSVLWEQKLSDNVSSSVNVEYVNSDGKYKYQKIKKNKDGSIDWETTAIRQNGNISAFKAEAGLFGKLPDGKWNFKTYYYDSDRGIPGTVIKNAYERYQFAKQWDRNFFTQGSFQKDITSKYKILVNAKYAYDYTHFYNHEEYENEMHIMEVSRHIDNTYKQQEFYLSTAQQYSLFPFWDVALSADYQYNSMDANLPKFAYPERNTELVALATYLRFQRFKFQASLLGTFVQETVKNTTTSSAAPDKAEYTPTFLINYKPFQRNDFHIHGFYKRIFRMPTFNDLYYTEIGSSTLKPEYTTQYDIGLDYNKSFSSGLIRNISLVVDGYYNEVENKIIAYPKGQQFRWTMLNLGKVQIRGIDVSAQASLLLTQDLLLNIRGTYTYEDAENLTPGTSYYKDQIPYTPWNSGSFLAGLVYKSWNLNYSFIYTGERYNGVANIPDNYESPWFTHDISVTKEIALNDKIKLKAGLEINNIFDKRYEIVENYPMPGRNYRVSLRVNL